MPQALAAIPGELGRDFPFDVPNQRECNRTVLKTNEGIPWPETALVETRGGAAIIT